MRTRYLILSLSAILGFSSASHAARDFGLPGEFLNFGVGARPLAMGRAFTGVADDIDSLYWNPAGLATFRSNQVTLQYSPLPLGGAHQYLAYGQPLYNYGNFGVGIVNMGSGNVERRDANNIDVGDYDSRETAIMLSYAHRLKQVFALGGTLKVVELDLDDRKAMGFGADLGALYTHKEFLRFGAMLRNAIPPKYKFSTDDEKFPIILRVGSSAKFFNNALLAAVDLDKTLGTPQGMKWHIGLEGRLIEALVLRAGLDSTEITTGLGFKWRTYQFDYAAGFQDLGLANRASIKYFFGGYEVDVKASPRVFSPVGLKNSTAFKIRVANRERVVQWILTIRNTQGEVVRSFQGFKDLPKRFDWDGKDSNGKIVAGGEYSYRMSVTDSKNVTEFTPERTLKILAPTPFEIEAR
ncbi:MAG: hypothetical protein A2901_03105 [Elusimicrobia bacterium RIFCSPLOWO2_01_FULL_54_10]|nr:MAG: hypothetical protein A2901_03105 [Elusimicrobia bacterium RIFCSPLOWO2_01_FULL_54_10]